MRFGLLLIATGLIAAAPAFAQTSTYRSATAQSGKPTRIWAVSAIKKDCSVGQIGGVKVLTPPKNGTLALTRGKTTSPASFRCPNVETPIELVIYQSNPKFTGSDEVTYETKNADGVVEKHTIRIEVTDKPGAPAKKDAPVDL